MITDLERFENLKNVLKEITGIAYFNKEDLITLCPKCERDRFKKYRNHGHLYISKINPIFHCYRCDYKGLILKIFNDFELNASDFIDINSIVYKKDYLNVDKFNNKEYNYSIKNPDINVNDNQYEVKLNYLNSRIQNFNLDDNVILDIGKFLHYNNINIDIDEKFRKYLYTNFVGFLCSRKSLMVCRNIDPNSTFRYYKIELKDIYFKDIFSIEINNTSNKIALCEGIFDLYNILNNKDLQYIIKDCRCISTALNNSYVTSFISTLDFYKLVYSDNVVIFSDKDVQEYRYMNLYFNNSCGSLTLYYNKLDKDFGSTDIEIIKVPITKYWKKDNYNAQEKKGIRI